MEQTTECKAEWRRRICTKKPPSAADILEKSESILSRLAALEPVRTAHDSGTLMGFVPMPLEVNTFPLFTDHAMIVPYCYENNIVPVRVTSLDELAPGTLGILEPKRTEAVPLPEIMTVLVPGLAFDIHGNRLGRGKGYYDRFLSSLPPSVLTVGLAFDEAVYDSIPHNAYDVPVNVIVTENRIIERTVFGRERAGSETGSPAQNIFPGSI